MAACLQASQGLTARVDKLFAEWDKPDSPGCALAIIQDSRVIYKRGYGQADLDHEIPITPSSVFHVASVSKQFTAMAITLLANQGLLSLDDEVRKHIREVPDFGSPLTIRHLIHHTSGLRDQWSLLVMAGWRLSQDVVREEDVLDLVSRQKALNFAPGEEHLYSNTGYTLMAMIVKRVTGRSLREFAETNIFRPLGMNSTFFRDDHTVIVKNQAYAYNPAEGGGFRLSVPNYDTVGASSLLTTVEDLALWDQEFYEKRSSGAAVIAQMHTAGRLNSGEKLDYAFGLVTREYNGLKIVEHSGGDAGYRSHLMRFPEQRFSVACLCNLGSISPSRLSRQIADIYLAGELKKEDPKPAAAAVKLSEQELAAKAGLYRNPRTESLRRVALKDGKLSVQFGETGIELTPLDANRFLTAGQPMVLTFAPSRLSESFDGGKPEVFEAVEAVTPTSAELREFAGAYYSDELDATYRIELDDGKLWLKRRKDRQRSLDPAYRDAFSGPPGSLRFVRDAEKRVTGFLLNSGRILNFHFARRGP